MIFFPFISFLSTFGENTHLYSCWVCLLVRIRIQIKSFLSSPKEELKFRIIQLNSCISLNIFLGRSRLICITLVKNDCLCVCVTLCVCTTLWQMPTQQVVDIFVSFRFAKPNKLSIIQCTREKKKLSIYFMNFKASIKNMFDMLLMAQLILFE